MEKIIVFVGKALVYLVAVIIAINYFFQVSGNGKSYGIIWYYLFVR